MNGFKPNAVVHLQDPNMHHHEHPNHFYVPAQPHLHNQVAHPVMFIPGPAAVLSQPVQRLPVSFFISDDLKKELQRRSELMLKGSSHDDPDTAQLPRTIHRYYNLYPLENLREENVSKVFGLRTLTLKASAADGRCYALKKVDGIRLHESAVQCVAAWKKLTHSSIVPLREMFVNSAMDNTSTLFLAYDYFPGADTLEERFLRVRGEQERTPIPDDVVWSIAVQIASAMRAIHAAGLSCRIFPSKVLISGRSRVRVNWTGIEELLNWDLASKKNISGAQSEDFKCFGKLLLVLCHRSLLALQNVTKALEYIETTYSAEMRNLISRLLETKPAESNQSPLINDICQSISRKILEHLDRVQSTCDDLENDLMKELENGRMFRLLVKLGFINERPEFEQSTSWSETEDRYVLKLFRDFVFHQVYEDGSPSIDFAHVIDALNKLDAGAEEKVMLTSRDQKTTLFISYKDLRRMAGHAFDELFNKFVQSNDEYAKHIQIRNPNPTIGRPLVN
jgi:PAB-dependent poly(A)-specific ribonuclease subunit 3